MRKIILNVCFLIILPACLILPIKAQLDFAAFTYQRSLKDGGVPANGNYEIKLEFFDDSPGSNTFTSVAVVNGIFSVSMTGTTSFMSPATILAPRERITSAPFAISSLKTVICSINPAARICREEKP